MNLLKLDSFHRSKNAKFAEFAGWNMPISYSSAIEEHMFVRQKVGFFDVSHMGEFIIKGPDAEKFLNYVLTSDVKKLSLGCAMYSLLCNGNGGVIDDLIVYKLSEQAFFLCVNAINVKRDLDHLNNLKGSFNCDVIDKSHEYGLLAIQGPQSQPLLQEFLETNLDSLKKMQFKKYEFLKCELVIARSGYTGEDGFELFIPSECIFEITSKLDDYCTSGKATWVGLAARNTLRLEAGFCLHGHEITEEISPLEAGILWAVSMKKSDFVGKDAINNQIKVNEHGKVFHYKVNSRRIPRDNAEIFFKSEKAGKVLSGAFSPILQCPFGSAYVDKGFINKARETGWYAVVRDNILPLEFCKPVLKNI